MKASVPAELLEELACEASKALPKEACGLLLGVRDDDKYLVDTIRFSENITGSDPTVTFEIDPALHLKLQREAREGTQEVIGVWHSHPSSAAAPSEEDRRRSLVPGWLWLITDARTGKTAAFAAHDPDSHKFTAVTLEAV